MSERTALPAPAKAATPVPRRVLQRKCACGQHAQGGECEGCREKRERLQRKENGAGPQGVPPIVHDVLRSPGQPLDPSARAFLSPRFGRDLSQVRVHRDTRAADSAEAVGAQAYTVGRDIVFGEGRYAPESSRGRELLAHELTHVVQQAGAGSGESRSLEIAPGGSPLEREADGVARSIVGQTAPPSPAGTLPTTLQRQPVDDGPRPERRRTSAFETSLQNDRIDSFLKLHKFAVGADFLPMLDGKPTTLEAVIDAAVQPLVAPIPRSIVEERVRTRWIAMLPDPSLQGSAVSRRSFPPSTPGKQADLQVVTEPPHEEATEPGATATEPKEEIEKSLKQNAGIAISREDHKTVTSVSSEKSFELTFPVPKPVRWQRGDFSFLKEASFAAIGAIGSANQLTASELQVALKLINLEKEKAFRKFGVLKGEVSGSYQASAGYNLLGHKPESGMGFAADAELAYKYRKESPWSITISGGFEKNKSFDMRKWDPLVWTFHFGVEFEFGHSGRKQSHQR